MNQQGRETWPCLYSTLNLDCCSQLWFGTLAALHYHSLPKAETRKPKTAGADNMNPKRTPRETSVQQDPDPKPSTP